MNIVIVQERDENTIARLTQIWEGSVRATHNFLTEADIEKLRPLVQTGLKEIDNLWQVVDEKGISRGFMGTANSKLEMLFIEDTYRGNGIGGSIMSFLLEKHSINKVDVNEANEQAYGFYKRYGFKCYARSEYDEQGNNFPILHLEVKTIK